MEMYAAHDDHGDRDTEYDDDDQEGGQEDEDTSRGAEQQTEEAAHYSTKTPAMILCVT